MAPKDSTAADLSRLEKVTSDHAARLQKMGEQYNTVAGELSDLRKITSDLAATVSMLNQGMQVLIGDRAKASTNPTVSVPPEIVPVEDRMTGVFSQPVSFLSIQDQVLSNFPVSDQSVTRDMVQISSESRLPKQGGARQLFDDMPERDMFSSLQLFAYKFDSNSMRVIDPGVQLIIPNLVASMEDNISPTQGMTSKDISISILAELSKETLELHPTRGANFYSLNFYVCTRTHPVYHCCVWKSIIFLTVIPRYFQFVFDPGEKILKQCSSRLVPRCVSHNLLSTIRLNMPCVEADDFIWSNFYVFDKQSEDKYKSAAAEMCILYRFQTEVAEMDFYYSDSRVSTSAFFMFIADKIWPPLARTLNCQLLLTTHSYFSTYQLEDMTESLFLGSSGWPPPAAAFTVISAPTTMTVQVQTSPVHIQVWPRSQHVISHFGNVMNCHGHDYLLVFESVFNENWLGVHFRILSGDLSFLGYSSASNRVLRDLRVVDIVSYGVAALRGACYVNGRLTGVLMLRKWLGIEAVLEIAIEATTWFLNKPLEIAYNACDQPAKLLQWSTFRFLKGRKLVVKFRVTTAACKLWEESHISQALGLFCGDTMMKMAGDPVLNFRILDLFLGDRHPNLRKALTAVFKSFFQSNGLLEDGSDPYMLANITCMKIIRPYLVLSSFHIAMVVSCLRDLHIWQTILCATTKPKTRVIARSRHMTPHCRQVFTGIPWKPGEQQLDVSKRYQVEKEFNVSICLLWTCQLGFIEFLHCLWSSLFGEGKCLLLQSQCNVVLHSHSEETYWPSGDAPLSCGDAWSTINCPHMSWCFKSLGNNIHLHIWTGHYTFSSLQCILCYDPDIVLWYSLFDIVKHSIMGIPKLQRRQQYGMNKISRWSVEFQCLGYLNAHGGQISGSRLSLFVCAVTHIYGYAISVHSAISNLPWPSTTVNEVNPYALSETCLQVFNALLLLVKVNYLIVVVGGTWVFDPGVEATLIYKFKAYSKFLSLCHGVVIADLDVFQVGDRVHTVHLFFALSRNGGLMVARCFLEMFFITALQKWSRQFLPCWCTDITTDLQILESSHNFAFPKFRFALRWILLLEFWCSNEQISTYMQQFCAELLCTSKGDVSYTLC